MTNNFILFLIINSLSLNIYLLIVLSKRNDHMEDFTESLTIAIEQVVKQLSSKYPNLIEEFEDLFASYLDKSDN